MVWAGGSESCAVKHGEKPPKEIEGNRIAVVHRFYNVLSFIKEDFQLHSLLF
jgi:hypothetical protein